MYCSDASAGVCSVEFILSRVQFRTMMYAIHTLPLDTVFPSLSLVETLPFSQISSLQTCLNEMPKLRLYDAQKRAVEGILDPGFKQVIK